MRFQTMPPTSLSLPFAAAVFALAVLAPAQTPPPTPAPAAAPKPAPRLQKGDVAPKFTVEDAKGKPVALADFAGKIVIVDVSATWCGPCQAAMPNNDRVYRTYADQGVVLLGICADDTRDNYRGWIERNQDKYRFPMLFDPAGKEGWETSVFNAQYHVTGFPTMFVIGRDGRIAETLGGGGPGEDHRLEYALARAGAKVDLASLPPEPKRDPDAPKSVPMLKKTAAMPAIGMAGAAGAAASGGGLVPAKFGSVARGTAVPDFTLEGADGRPLSLASLRGKGVLLHFHTSNGPQPWIEPLAKKYAAQGLTTLCVFAASEHDAFTKWLADHPQPGFLVAWDKAGKAWAEGVTNTVFGVGMYPATAVLKADGTLLSGTIGMGDKVSVMVKAMLAASGVKLDDEDRAAVTAGKAAATAAEAAGKAAPPPPPKEPPKPEGGR